MTNLTVMQRLRARRKQAQQLQLPNYRDLIEKLGQGEEPPLEEIEGVLDAAGKTEEDLESDLRNYHYTKPSLSVGREFLQLDAAMRAADREAEQARADRERLTAELEARVATSEKASWAAYQAASSASMHMERMLEASTSALRSQFLRARKELVDAEKAEGPGAEKRLQSAQAGMEKALLDLVAYRPLPGDEGWSQKSAGLNLVPRRFLDGGRWMLGGGFARPAHQAQLPEGLVPGMGSLDPLEQPLRTGFVPNSAAPAGL